MVHAPKALCFRALSAERLWGSVVPVGVRSVPLVGTVKSVRWKPEVDWPSSKAERIFSSRIAEHLGRHPGLVDPVRTGLVSRIDALPYEASWAIKGTHGQQTPATFNTLWEVFDMLAASLLAMPIPLGH